MKSNQSKQLSMMVGVILILLAIQYELGMFINLSPDLPELPAFGFSLQGISNALHQAGLVALVHAILGSFLALMSLWILIFSLRSKTRSVKILGSLGFLLMIAAWAGGVLFTLSGFQDDHYSLAMASDFILAFSFYFLELYFLKPGSSN